MPAVYPSSFGNIGNASMYLALRPTESFAQKRADQQAKTQLALGGLQLAQQEYNIYEQNRRELQKTLDYVKQMPMLPRGLQIVQQKVVQPLRDEIFKKIKEKYNGNERDFLQQEGNYYEDLVLNKLSTDPVVEQQLKTKTNVALAMKDLSDGKVLKGGNYFDKALSDYNAGAADFIDYTGGYKPPKGILDIPLKNFHPDASYKYGIHDSTTGKYSPVPFTRAEYVKYALDKGMKDDEVVDWLTHHENYQDGMATWKMGEAISPYQAESLKRQDRNYGLSVQRYNLSKLRFANTLQQQAKADAEGSVLSAPTTSQYLFDPRTGGEAGTIAGGRVEFLKRNIVPDQALKDRLLTQAGIVAEGTGDNKIYRFAGGSKRFISPKDGVTYTGSVSVPINVDDSQIYLFPPNGGFAKGGQYNYTNTNGTKGAVVPTINVKWKNNDGSIAEGYFAIPLGNSGDRAALLDYIDKANPVNSTKKQIQNHDINKNAATTPRKTKFKSILQ
jgi:hypothetical protein